MARPLRGPLEALSPDENGQVSRRLILPWVPGGHLHLVASRFVLRVWFSGPSLVFPTGPGSLR